MTTMPVSTVINAIVTLLTEAYDGPPNPSESWFIDNEPDSGVLGILKGVSAKEASKSADGSGNAGTTIASHAEHLRWTLENANNTFRGQPWNPKWNESWELLNADETAWNQLRQSLRAEYESLRAFLQVQEELKGEYLVGVLALIPHAAYHLGNIRQMVERVRGA